MEVTVFVQDMEKEIRAHRGWYIFEGIFFLVMGVLVIMLPNVTTLATTMLFGAALSLSGIIQSATFFRYPKKWWKLISGIAFIVAGVIVAFVPMAGLLTLAFIIGLILFIEGFFEIMFALAFKPFPGWVWLMLSGILALGLAFFVLLGFPAATILFLSIAIGINMGTYGMSILLLAMKSGNKSGE